MKIQLSDHFTYHKLLRFVFPTIIMMIFTSIYGVIDGLFVSNFVGKTPFAALNLVMPFVMILGGMGFMIGTGGSALVAMELGCGRKEKANQTFTMLILFTIILGVLLSITGMLLIRIIRAGNDCFYRRFYVAERISELSCSCRKAKAWTFRHHNRRRYQCPAGRCFYCRLQMGAGRSGSCHRNRTVHRRHTALDLLFKAEFQPASADSCQTGAKTDPENLCQRLLRGHVQRFFLHR